MRRNTFKGTKVSVTVASESGRSSERWWLRDGHDGDVFVAGIPGMLSSLVLDAAEATEYDDLDEAMSRFWTWFAVVSKSIGGRIGTVRLVPPRGRGKIVRNS